MGAYDRDRLRGTYRKSTFWSTLFFVPFVICTMIMAANADSLPESWTAGLLAGALGFGLLAAGFGYPASRIVFFEARRHPEFADELWLHNCRRAGAFSWIVGLFSALVILNVDLIGWLDISGAVAAGVIALSMMLCFQASMIWLEWRAEM